MVSALLSLENSVAVFEVPTADVQEDPETGNIVPVNETLSYRLYLRRGASTSPGAMSGSNVCKAAGAAPRVQYHLALQGTRRPVAVSEKALGRQGMSAKAVNLQGAPSLPLEAEIRAIVLVQRYKSGNAISNLNDGLA